MINKMANRESNKEERIVLIPAYRNEKEYEIEWNSIHFISVNQKQIYNEKNRSTPYYLLTSNKKGLIQGLIVDFEEEIPNIFLYESYDLSNNNNNNNNDNIHFSFQSRLFHKKISPEVCIYQQEKFDVLHILSLPFIDHFNSEYKNENDQISPSSVQKISTSENSPFVFYSLLLFVFFILFSFLILFIYNFAISVL